MAATTKRITLGTAVTNPYGRPPFLLANAFATLDELSGGRMVLGIGAGNAQRMQGRLGLAPTKPLKVVRDAVQEIRRLWGHGQRSSLGYGPSRASIPIMIAAVQEKMLRLAGEVGDGVIFSKASSPEFILQAMKHVTRGRRSRRARNRFDVVALITCILDEDESRAEAAAKRQIVGWLVRPGRGELLLRSIGRDTGLLGDLRRISSSKGSNEAAKALPSSVVQHFAVYGDADSCVRGIERFRRAGVTIPIISTTPERQEKLLVAISASDSSVKA